MSIEFVRLTKGFGERVILEGVDLTVPTGQILFIVGASGAGKSVLMRHVIGLLKPDAGKVYVDGTRVDTLGEQDLFAVRKQCGFVFQHPALLDFLTLVENVALPLIKREGLGRREARDLALEWLGRVGITRDADRKPAALGAGVKKRAAIARALALSPRYVVYDEPTTGLDPVNARRIDSLIRRLADDTGVTTIVVSHDRTSIFSVADRIAFLYNRRVYFEATAEAFRDSDDPVVKQFVTGSTVGPMGV